MLVGAKVQWFLICRCGTIATPVCEYLYRYLFNISCRIYEEQPTMQGKFQVKHSSRSYRSGSDNEYESTNCPPLTVRDDDRHTHHLSTSSLHPQQPSKNLRTAFTCSSQRYYCLPHRRRPRFIITTLSLHVHIYTTKHPLPRHPPTLWNLPWQTRSRHAGRSRLETAHADGVSRAHARGRWYDTLREGTGRGGKRARERGADGRTTEGGA